jgi:hypothetical protein
LVDGINLYAYVRNDPVLVSDPTGTGGEVTLEPVRIEGDLSLARAASDYAYNDSVALAEKYGPFVQELESSLVASGYLSADETPARRASGDEGSSSGPTIRAVTQEDDRKSNEFESEVAACDDHTTECKEQWPDAYKVWQLRKADQDAENLRRRASAAGVSVRDQMAAEKAVQLGQLALTAVDFGLIGSGVEEEAVTVIGSRGSAADVRTTVSASRGTGWRPAELVREIEHGEKLANVLDEVRFSQFETGEEHAIASMKDGSRGIYKGGSGGILWDTAATRRVMFHTHPSFPGQTPTLGPSTQDRTILLPALGQSSGYVLQNGGVFRFWQHGSVALPAQPQPWFLR